MSYTEFNFNSVPQDERKFVRLLAKELGKVDWSTKSVKSWIMVLQKQFNENFIVSRQGRLAVIFNACSKSTQDRLLAANFGGEIAEEEYTFILLIKTLGGHLLQRQSRSSHTGGVGTWPQTGYKGIKSVLSGGTARRIYPSIGACSGLVSASLIKPSGSCGERCVQ